MTGRHHVAAKPYYKPSWVYRRRSFAVTVLISLILNQYCSWRKCHRQTDGSWIYHALANARLKMVICAWRHALLEKSSYRIHGSATWMVWDIYTSTTSNIQKVDDFRSGNRCVWVRLEICRRGRSRPIRQTSICQDHFNGERSPDRSRRFRSEKETAKAMRLLVTSEPLGIRLEEYVAVGDNHNDISMLPSRRPRYSYGQCRRHR